MVGPGWEHLLPQKRGSNLLAYKMAFLTRPELGHRVPLCGLEGGTVLGQTTPRDLGLAHGPQMDLHPHSPLGWAPLSNEQLVQPQLVAVPRPQLEGQSPRPFKHYL